MATTEPPMVKTIVSLSGWRKHTAALLRDSDHVTGALRRHALTRLQSTPLADPDWQRQLANRLFTKVSAGKSLPIEHNLRTALAALVALEAQAFVVPAPTPGSLLAEVAERTHLRRLIAFAEHADPFLADWTSALADVLTPLAAASPPAPSSNPSTLTIGMPLIAFLTNPNATLSEIIARFLRLADNADGPLRPGARLAGRLIDNLLTASGITRDEAERRPQRLKWPVQSQLEPPELVATYFADTPLHDLLLAPIPLPMTQEIRFEHMHIVGGAGHGKTQTLQHLIATDLASSDPPSLIIIDSHGDMLAAIERLDLFHPDHGRLTDRLIIIDPEDVDYPPALNMFHMGSDRLATYTAAQREQVEAATIELYDYIFRALSADLTSKQGVAFAFVARLLLNISGATIHTLRELMEDQSPSIDKSPFCHAISRLDDTARAFFAAHFFTRAFADTKRQIARRIYDFIRNKTFERMFSSRVNKVDMFEAMNSGAIVLVNTSKALLKSAASALFGRYMIALTLRAAFERVAIPPEQRRPAFLIIDEAADYFDANVDALLTQVRKFKLGLVFAHQYLDQLDGSLRASFAANTAIKFAGGVSDKDARALAPDMRCRAEFITGQRKHGHHTTFAAYVRNLTPTALSLTIPFGTLDRLPQMTPATRLALRERNRHRYTADPRPTTSPQSTSTAEPVTVAHDDPNWISGTRAR
jgi:hypothetical protein